MPEQKTDPGKNGVKPDTEALRRENRDLRMWQEQFLAILDALQEGVQVVNRNGVVTYVNKSFEKILGEQAADRLGKNIYEISPNGALVETLRTHKTVFGKIHTTLNGKKVVSSNSSPIKIGGVEAGAVCVFSDISDIKKMSRLLERNEQQIRQLKERVQGFAEASYTLDDIIGGSHSMRSCVELAKKVANSGVTVLLSGESGTGKELFAHSIHNASKRADAPFIKINCAAIPEQLLESEFFGYEPGAFSGAVKAKMGKFELADKGTLFLDEIGEMSLMLQAKLLRVLQDKEVERLGAVRSRKVDVRVITATNRDLQQEVANGNFRQDLYYRLNMFGIHIPPLRERPDDIPLLARHIIDKLNREYESSFTLTPARAEAMRQMPWPGNVREMENYLGKLVLLSQDAQEDEAVAETSAGGAPEEPALSSLEEQEKRMIFKALEKYGYDLVGKQRAAKELRIALSTLYNKLKKYKQD